METSENGTAASVCLATSPATVPAGTMLTPASISTARLTVSMLSNSITTRTATPASRSTLSTALRVGMSG